MLEKISDFTELLMPDDLLSQNSILAHTRNAMTEEAQDAEVIGSTSSTSRKEGLARWAEEEPEDHRREHSGRDPAIHPHWIVRYLVEFAGRLWLMNRPGSKPSGWTTTLRPRSRSFLRIKSPKKSACDPACGSAHMLTVLRSVLRSTKRKASICRDPGADPWHNPPASR